MTHKSKITIITSTLNCVEEFKRTVNSISKFHNENIQWIVIDGLSHDGTLECIKKNQNLISIWSSEADSGIYNAWNKALNYIEGDWILFLGAGDTIPIEWINLLIKRPPIEDIIYSNILVHDCHKTYLSFPMSWEYIAKNMRKNMFFKHPGMAHNKRLFEKNKFNENFRIISDWVFLVESNLQSVLCIKDMIQADFYTGGVSSTYSGACLAFKETKEFRKSIGDPMNIRESFNWIFYIFLLPLRDLANFFYKKLAV